MLFSRKSVLAALALAQGAMSFGDTSPQIFLSSSADLNTAALQQSQASSFTLSSSAFDSAVASALSGCPADAYIFVNQPAAHTYDLADSDGTANLRHYFQQAASKYIFPHVRTTDATSIPENEDGLSPLAQQVAEKCAAKVVKVDTQASGFEGFVDTTPRVVVLNFPTLPTVREKEARAAALQHNDGLLSTVIGGLPSGNYVIVYTSAPESAARTFSKKSQVFDADEEENVLGEAGIFQKNTENEEDTEADEFKTEFKVGDSLFEKYQYFSPGIFETTLVALGLVYIFFTAYGWIATLEISYNAFDKPPQIPSATKAQ